MAQQGLHPSRWLEPPTHCQLLYNMYCITVESNRPSPGAGGSDIQIQSFTPGCSHRTAAPSWGRFYTVCWITPPRPPARTPWTPVFSYEDRIPVSRSWLWNQLANQWDAISLTVFQATAVPWVMQLFRLRGRLCSQQASQTLIHP